MSAPSPSWTPVTDAARTMRDIELMQAIPLCSAAFYKRKARGHFRFLEITPQLPDGPTLYSRAKVRRWLDGELQEPEAARFLGRARRQPNEKRRPGRPRKGNTPPAVVHAFTVAGGSR